ncbi:MAG: hypothetical protein PUI85_01785 [Eubacteriales bacterium]|nr:hypothetical protein [Eubacteriales bacterium]MDY3332879.1 hypothetical protein [Gallibacter sp.]
MNMKKIAILLICILITIGISACGNVSNVKIKEVKSEIYSKHDIDMAINSIKKEFRLYWHGCTLKEIYYAGDSVSKDAQDWADRNNADEVIVLQSSFDVNASGGDGSLEPNTAYDDWMWILVRTHGGQWKHVDHGY